MDELTTPGSDRAHRAMFAAGAALTGIALLLLAIAPPVPSDPAAMNGWVDGAASLLSWSDELLFFAIVLWGAGARGMLRSRTAPRISAGAVALAVALVALLVILLAVGRLVYPVFGIDLTPDVVALLISTTFGALHLALLGFAVAAVTLTWSTRIGLAGRLIGIAAAAAFVVGSFPWLTPTWWNVTVALILAAWGILLAVVWLPRPADAASA